MPRLDGCTETVAPDELTASELIEVVALLLTHLGLVVTRSDWGRGAQLDIIAKDAADARADAYEQEHR